MMNKDLEERQIEMMLAYIPPYSEENAKNIKHKFEQKAKERQRKSSYKKIFLAGVAASLALITTLAYAAGVDLSKIYKRVFGENAGYVEQYIEPLSGTESSAAPLNDNGVHESAALLSTESEYDGIVIKLISAINDENFLQIFLTATDTKGDRLGESLEFKNWGLSQGYGGGMNIVEYDNETKTAVLMITSLGGAHEGSATLSIDGFAIGRELLENLPEAGIDITSLLQDYSPEIVSQDKIWKRGGGGDSRLYEESPLLAVDGMDIPFHNSDLFSISNAGFVDGVLHIQAKVALEGDALTDGYYVNVKFVNDENEIVYDSAAQIDFLSDREYAYESYSKEPHDSYREIIFDNITSLDQIQGLSLAMDYMKSPKTTEGFWEFSFMVPEKVTTEFQIDKEIVINEQKIRIDMVSLSPLGVTVHLTQNMSAEYSHNDEVYITYGDGRTVWLNQSAIHTYEGASTLIFSGEVIEIESAQTLAINGVEIDISQ